MEGERPGWITQTSKLLQTMQSSISCTYVESFREEQKICLNVVRRPRPGRFRDSSNELWRPSFFNSPRIMNVIKGNVGESISTIIIVAPLVAIMKPSSGDLE